MRADGSSHPIGGPHHEIPKAGLARSVWNAVKRAIPRSLLGFGRTWIVEGPLARDGSQPDPLDRVRRATFDDLGVLEALGMPPEFARRRLESGAQISIGELAGQPAGCVCHHLERCNPEPWLEIETRTGAAFAFGTLAAPAQRGKGVAVGLGRYAEGLLAAEGYSHIIGAIDCSNHSSLRLTEKLGRTRVGRYAYIRILGLTFFISPGAFRVGRFGAERPLSLPISAFDHRRGARWSGG
jgi:GNAT superfamily N-acetyltransferase